MSDKSKLPFLSEKDERRNKDQADQVFKIEWDIENLALTMELLLNSREYVYDNFTPWERIEASISPDRGQSVSGHDDSFCPGSSKMSGNNSGDIY